jgi:hypothetical protein
MIVALAFCLAGKELHGLYGYFSYLKDTGGRRYYSGAVYDLAEYLIKEKAQKVIVGSWGLHNIITIASEGRIPSEAAEYWPVKYSDPRELKDIFRDTKALYVFYPMEVSPSANNIDSFIRAAKEQGAHFVEKKRFYERDGGLLYIVMGAAG